MASPFRSPFRSQSSSSRHQPGSSGLRRGPTLWKWFFFFVVVCFGHYYFCLSRLSLYIHRLLDVLTINNNHNHDAPHLIASQNQRQSEVGMIACIEDENRDSTLQAMVLAQGIQDDFGSDDNNFVFELYHNGTLSRFLQGHLETSYPFVTVVDLNWNHNNTNKRTTCLGQALHMTKLQHVMVLPSLSLQFLQSPSTLLQKMKADDDRHCQRLSCGKCVMDEERLLRDNIEENSYVVNNSNKDDKTPYGKIEQTFHRFWNKTIPVASIYKRWIQFEQTYLQWETYNDIHNETFQFIPLQSNKNATATFPMIQKKLQQHWKRQWDARRTILLDRPVEWVAFDGGFHADDSSTLNTLQAARKSLEAGTHIVNIDIALTLDHELVAVHNDKSITPADFADSKLTTTIANLNLQQTQQLTNPCLPQSIVHRSLLPNPYQPYKCQSEPISHVSEFVNLLQTPNNNNQHTATEMILDLKAPNVATQVEQARMLAKSFVPSLSARQLAVRFFSVFGEDDRLAATVFPEQALQALATDPSLEGIAYYVNVPSSTACLQMAGWIQNQTSFNNQLLQGCYVILDHLAIRESWLDFATTHNVDTNYIPSNLTMTPKMICDVPRKLSFRDPSLWTKEYNHCLKEGFDYIHDPFPPPLHASTDRLSLLTPRLPDFYDKVRQSTTARLGDFRKPTSSKKKVGRVVHFSWGTSWDWHSRQTQWYSGTDRIKWDDPRIVLTKKDKNFRCVTKVLTVLLFLKFQEMGYLSINDVVSDGNMTHTITYRNIFTNTAGGKGSVVGEQFVYANEFWAYIPAAFEYLTGLRFSDAMDHYIIQPMGLKGYYDVTNTTMPPYAGRGYNGEPEDLLVIGGTLSSRGVSPLTRKQIVSPESVELMLTETITNQNLTESYKKDTIVREMTRVYNRTGDFPLGFSKGYGMGIWTVRGWRYTAQGQPILGWLAQGSNMVYFDTTGLVVSFLCRGGFTSSIVKSYSRIIRDIGDYSLTAIPGVYPNTPSKEELRRGPVQPQDLAAKELEAARAANTPPPSPRKESSLARAKRLRREQKKMMGQSQQRSTGFSLTVEEQRAILRERQQQHHHHQQQQQELARGGQQQEPQKSEQKQQQGRGRGRMRRGRNQQANA